jgi:hypothetical protein
MFLQLFIMNGSRGVRTPDILRVKQTLLPLNYAPNKLKTTQRMGGFTHVMSCLSECEFGLDYTTNT